MALMRAPPRTIGGIDARVRKFAGYVVRGRKPLEAAALVGVPAEQRAEFCAEAMSEPVVIRYIKQRHASTISAQIVPLAISRHQRMLESDSTPPAVLARLIDIAYSYGLAGADAPDDDGQDDASSVAQLELQAATLRARIEQRLANMKTVNPDPGSLFE